MNDVRKMIYGTIILFFGVLVFWLSIIYISSCGLTLTCTQAVAKADTTPIPTLIPAVHAEPQMGESSAEFNKCQVVATDLIGAWVTAESPETEPFAFSDVNGHPCEGTFTADIQPLFVENSLWYTGALGCVSCHNSALSDRSAGLDLTAHETILMGSGRAADSTAQGADILGGGVWETSALHRVLVEQGLGATGHSADSPAVAVLVFAGQAVAVEEVTATPTP
jgi:hypothetical protein